MSHLPIFIISDNFEGEKCCSYPELRDEKTRRLEFNSSSLLILNSLEQLGYKVVTSGSFVASQVGEILKLLEINRFLCREDWTSLFRKSSFGQCTEPPKICSVCSLSDQSKMPYIVIR